jgi:hypothetical protein
MRIPTKFNPKLQSTTKFYDGQRYELVRTQRYTRVDGSETTLSVWQSECPVCGEAFEVRTPALELALREVGYVPPEGGAA